MDPLSIDTYTHKSNSFKCHLPLLRHIGRLQSDRAFRQHKRYLLEHLNPFDGQTVLKSDPLILREQVSGVVIQQKGQPDIIDRSYSGWHVCVQHQSNVFTHLAIYLNEKVCPNF